jgi:hypothetical protein
LVLCLETVYRFQISRNIKRRGEQHPDGALQTSNMIHAFLRRSSNYSCSFLTALTIEAYFSFVPERQMVHGPHPRSDTPHDDNNNAMAD